MSTPGSRWRRPQVRHRKMADGRAQVFGRPRTDAQTVRPIGGIWCIDDEAIQTGDGFMPCFRHNQCIGHADAHAAIAAWRDGGVSHTQRPELGRMVYNELEQEDILSGVRVGLALLAYTDILLCSIWAIHKIRQTPVLS